MNTLLFSLGSFGSKILSILLIRFYTAYMMPSEFSNADLIQQTANLLIPIATLSITEGVLRFGLDKKTDYTQVYSTGISVTMAGLIIMLVFFPLLGLIPDLQGNLLILFIFMITSSMRMLNQYFARSMGRVKLFAVDGIIATFVMCIMNILFLAVLGWGVKGYLLSIIISDGLSAIFLMCMMKSWQYIKLRQIKKSTLIEMVKFSVPLIPTYILWWIVGLSDRYMVRYMINPEANGLYTAAYKIPTMLSVVSTIFFQAWQMSAITEYGSESTRKFYSKVFEAYQSMLFLAAGGILLLLKPLISIFLDKSYADAYYYIPLLVAAVLMQCFCQFMSSIYSAAKKTKNSLITSLIAAFANIILNMILIPNENWGVQGAAFATLIAYTLCFLARLYDTRKIINYDVNLKKMVLNSVILIAMCCLILTGIENVTVYLFAGCCIIAAVNLKPLVATVKKILKRS